MLLGEDDIILGAGNAVNTNAATFQINPPQQQPLGTAVETVGMALDGGGEGMGLGGNGGTAAPANPNHQRNGDDGIDGVLVREFEKLINRDMDNTLVRELAWQWEVKGDKIKMEEFGEQAVGMQTFRAFAFVKGKLPVVHMGHTLRMFFIWMEWQEMAIA
jgi:hypothetical protein